MKMLVIDDECIIRTGIIKALIGKHRHSKF